MKIIIENPTSFTLDAETHGDKMWIAQFYKEMVENKLENNCEVLFRYSDKRIDQNAPKGGGFLDIEMIVPSLYDAEQENRIAMEEIECLIFYNYHI